MAQQEELVFISDRQLGLLKFIEAFDADSGAIEISFENGDPVIISMAEKEEKVLS